MNSRQRGEDVAIMAATNETVRTLNDFAQDRRIRARELDAASTVLNGRRFCIGDEVVTRRNQRDLHTHSGQMVKNRDRFTIAEFTRTGITVTGHSGTVTLPRGYAEECVELGYAQTGHGSQGRTVDTALLLIDGPVDVRGVYVPMTRGRYSNTAYVVCRDDRDPVEVFAEAVTRDWIDQSAHVRHGELNPKTVTGEPAVPVPLPRGAGLDLIRREAELDQAVRVLNGQIAAAPGRLARAETDKARLIAQRARLLARAGGREARLRELSRFGHRRRNGAAIGLLRDGLDRDHGELEVVDRQLVDVDLMIADRRAQVAGLDGMRAERDRGLDERHQVRLELALADGQQANPAPALASVVGRTPSRSAERLDESAMGIETRGPFASHADDLIDRVLEPRRRPHGAESVLRIGGMGGDRSIGDEYGISL